MVNMAHPPSQHNNHWLEAGKEWNYVRVNFVKTTLKIPSSVNVIVESYKTNKGGEP